MDSVVFEGSGAASASLSTAPAVSVTLLLDSSSLCLAVTTRECRDGEMNAKK